MSMDPAKVKRLREAEIRDKLPDDVVALIDSAQLDPPVHRSNLMRWRCSQGYVPTTRRHGPGRWQC